VRLENAALSGDLIAGKQWGSSRKMQPGKAPAAINRQAYASNRQAVVKILSNNGQTVVKQLSNYRY